MNRFIDLEIGEMTILYDAVPSPYALNAPVTLDGQISADERQIIGQNWRADRM